MKDILFIVLWSVLALIVGFVFWTVFYAFMEYRTEKQSAWIEHYELFEKEISKCYQHGGNPVYRFHVYASPKFYMEKCEIEVPPLKEEQEI